MSPYMKRLHSSTWLRTLTIYSYVHPIFTLYVQGKKGVFSLSLENNNGTFEVSPSVAERRTDFVIRVRDNAMLDHETNNVLTFKVA